MYMTFSSMTKENLITGKNAIAFPEAANGVFDIIQEQLFNDQFTPETSSELDKVFFRTILDKDIEHQERLSFILMYVQLKKLLVVVSKKVVPKTINEITIDISYCFS